MLTITQKAAEAIDAIVASADVPETAGLRIAQEVGPEGRGGFALSVVETPEASDQVVESEGSAPVFVEPEAAPLLDEKVLDAQIEAGQVGFVLADQG